MTGEKTEEKVTDKSKATDSTSCAKANGEWVVAQCDGEKWTGTENDCTGEYTKAYCK